MGSRRRAVAGCILLGALTLFAVWRGRHWLLIERFPRAPERLSTPVNSAFRNTGPGVRYVGDETCAHCHPDIAETYHRHPMGRASAPTEDILSQEQFQKQNHDPFEAAGLLLSVEPRGTSEYHKIVRQDAEGKKVCGSEAAVQFVIGAGVRGRSYVINRGGYLYQSPISWYTDRQAWDLSPHLGGTVQQLYRPVTVQCLFCHCNSVEAEEDAGNKYRSPIIRGYSIGCERCHGPGELHVQSRQAAQEAVAGPDYTIVNPAHLDPALREAVCQQCHMQGLRVRRRGRQVFDFRPGLPLQLFLSVFIPTYEQNRQHKFAGHVEQMYSSRCFQESKGKLGCISCHDPHRKPDLDQRVAFYRSRCLSCHEEGNCPLPLSDRSSKTGEDNCFACHMQRIPNTNIAHMASTDHRILRQPDSTERASPTPEHAAQTFDAFAYFFRGQADRDDPEIERDLGVGLMDLAALKQPEHNRNWLAQNAQPALERAVQFWPEDVAAWQANGYALWILERRPEAMSAFEKALALAPRREEALVYAAGLSTQLSNFNDAVDYWKRALAVNPYSVRSHFGFAQLLGQRHEWQQCLAESEASLRYDPFQAPARKLLITALVQLGQKDKAALELDKVLRMNPGEKAAIRAWFDGESGAARK